MSKLSTQSVQLSGIVVAFAVAVSGIGQVALAARQGTGHRTGSDHSSVELVGPSIVVGDLAAGDTTERATELVNHRGRPVNVVRLDGLSDGSSPLTLDRVHGLRVAVDRCDQSWGGKSSATVDCPSQPTAVMNDEPVGGATDRSMSPVRIPAGDRLHLRIRLALPSSAGNDLMGQSASIRIAFTVTDV